MYLKSLSLDHTEFAKSDLENSLVVFFPLVHVGDASEALMPNTNYLHFSKCHKHNFITGSEKLAELLPFPTYHPVM